MSELSDVVDEAVDALKDANRVGKRDRGSDRGVMGALQNGFGLVAVRLCIFFMTVIVGLTGYIITDKMERFTKAIENVDEKVDKFGTTLENFMKDTVDARNMDRIDIIHLQDTVKMTEQKP